MLRLRVAYSRSERARSLALALVPSAELRIAALRLQMRNAPRAPLSLLPCAVLLPSQLRKAQLYSQLSSSRALLCKNEKSRTKAGPSRRHSVSKLHFWSKNSISKFFGIFRNIAELAIRDGAFGACYLRGLPAAGSLRSPLPLALAPNPHTLSSTIKVAK